MRHTYIHTHIHTHRIMVFKKHLSEDVLQNRDEAYESVRLRAVGAASEEMFNKRRTCAQDVRYVCVCVRVRMYVGAVGAASEEMFNKRRTCAQDVRYMYVCVCMYICMYVRAVGCM
jgi:hypothetical protein